MNNEKFQELFDAFMNFKGVGFVSLQYRNKEGELSKRLLNVGAKYDNAVKKDIETLNAGVEYVPSEKYTRADWDMALTEKKKSLVQPDETRSNAQVNAYLIMNDNGTVKYNYEKQEFYLFAKSEKKEVLEAGVYKQVNSRPKTIAKKAIEGMMKSTKFRTFIIKKIAHQVKINREVIEIDGQQMEADVIHIIADE